MSKESVIVFASFKITFHEPKRFICVSDFTFFKDNSWKKPTCGCLKDEIYAYLFLSLFRRKKIERTKYRECEV